MSINMEPTPQSESVAEIGYDDVNQEVWVTFRTGASYVYSNVPAPVWEELRAAPSTGSAVNQVLKPGYLYRRV